MQKYWVYLKITYSFVLFKKSLLTLILLTWRIGWVPKNASKWSKGFNSAFKGLSTCSPHLCGRRSPFFRNWLLAQSVFRFFGNGWHISASESPDFSLCIMLVCLNVACICRPVCVLHSPTVFHSYHLVIFLELFELYNSSLDNIPCRLVEIVCLSLLGTDILSTMLSHILNSCPSLLWYVSSVWISWMKFHLPKTIYGVRRNDFRCWARKEIFMTHLISKRGILLRRSEKTTAISRNIWQLDVDWNSVLT